MGRATCPIAIASSSSAAQGIFGRRVSDRSYCRHEPRRAAAEQCRTRSPGWAAPRGYNKIAGSRVLTQFYEGEQPMMWRRTSSSAPSRLRAHKLCRLCRQASEGEEEL